MKGIFKNEQIKIIVQNGKLKYPEQPLSDKSCFSTAICSDSPSKSLLNTCKLSSATISTELKVIN